MRPPGEALPKRGGRRVTWIVVACALIFGALATPVALRASRLRIAQRGTPEQWALRLAESWSAIPETRSWQADRKR